MLKKVAEGKICVMPDALEKQNGKKQFKTNKKIIKYPLKE